MLFNIFLSAIYPFVLTLMFLGLTTAAGEDASNVFKWAVAVSVILIGTYLKAFLLQWFSKKSINHAKLLLSAFLQLGAGYLTLLVLPEYISDENIEMIAAYLSLAIISGIGDAS